MKALLITILALLWLPAYAGEIEFRTGVGLNRASTSALYSVGYVRRFDKHYMSRLDMGYWSDSKLGHKSSTYASLSVGRMIGNRNGLYASIYMGVAFISHPDILLSTNFQFTEEVALGYRDAEIIFKHFSNAGIKKPNLGRDYPLVGYRWRF